MCVQTVYLLLGSLTSVTTRPQPLAGHADAGLTLTDLAAM